MILNFEKIFLKKIVSYIKKKRKLLKKKMSFVAFDNAPLPSLSAGSVPVTAFGGQSVIANGRPVGVGVGQAFTVTAAGPVLSGCNAGVARVAESPICWQATVNANPQLYMLSQSPCLVGQVCGNRVIRSYHLANAVGGNMFLTKGNYVQAGCATTLAAAPLNANPCGCALAHAN